MLIFMGVHCLQKNQFRDFQYTKDYAVYMYQLLVA